MKRFILVLIILFALTGCSKEIGVNEPVFAFKEQNESREFAPESDYIALAIEQQNISLCQNYISGQEHICYYRFALSKNNASYCNLASSFVEKEKCFEAFAKMSGEYEICSMIEMQYPRMMCYWQIANDTQRPEICTGIDELRDRQKCEYEAGKR